MTDYNFIEYFYMNIINGNGQVLISENNERLNNIALNLYQKEKLNNDDIKTLNNILTICNILYNRTDMEVLPINDSFYDLLLEKYKIYNPNNFQVGSLSVNINNIPSQKFDFKPIEKRSPFIFTENYKKNIIHEEIFDKILQTGNPIVNNNDRLPNFPINDETISKRLHDTSHNHPSLVGTLDKCKFVLVQDAIDAGCIDDPNVKILERDFFQDHIAKGIIDPNDIEIVCELKYDGVSVEADCTDRVISARTRGDTGAGVASDITPLLKDYRFKQASCMSNHDPIGVKFEAIITKTDLVKFNESRIDAYKNCRTSIVGIFGSSDGAKYRDLITLVPLAIDRNDIPEISNRIEEIEFINRLYRSNCEPLRYCYFRGTISEILFLIKAFWDEAKVARDILNFMYDGIVVSYVNEDIRNRLGRINYINKYSMAVKFDPIEKQTTFRGYTFEVGQNGQITPMLHYDPVEFIGTIHTKSSGSSLDRFNKLSLRYGDIINVEYRNDVMPYVTKAECSNNRNNPNMIIPFVTRCPICGSEIVISETGKTAYCPNMECPARSISRMTNMMAKLNLKGFAEATFKAIPEIDHLYKLFNYDEEFYIERLGQVDGHNFYECINKELYGLPDYLLFGSLGFTGIAKLKWKSILSMITPNNLYTSYKNFNNPEDFYSYLISTFPSIGNITSHTIAYEFEFFEKDILKLLDLNMQLSFGKNENSIQIRFTGCRNLQLATHLINRGYDCDLEGSVTKSTNILLVPYLNFESNKTKKASPNCLIIAIDDFESNMEMYLSRFEK